MGIQENRAFQEMLKVARERLCGRNPADIAKKAQIEFDSEHSEFHVNSLGTSITIHYPDYTITPGINEWHQLVILHYMDLADGTLPSAEFITFGQLQNGLIRGGGFDRQCEEVIRSDLGNYSEEQLEQACKALGAEIVSSNADFCAVFPFLPYYPVTLKIWFADEEMDASGRMFLNKNADHYLTVEDAVTVGDVILNSLAEQLIHK